MERWSRTSVEGVVKNYFAVLGVESSATTEEVTHRLIMEGCQQKGLLLKTGNLLRRLEAREPWLVRVRNGEYRWVEPD